LIFVNVFWGLLNWLPIRPLDGGHLFEALLEKIAPKRVDSIARVVFTATAAAALIAAIRFQLIFVAVLSGWLLLSEFNIGRTPQPRAPIPPLTYDPPEAGIIDVDPGSEG
jgi:membrane-associated protease RseP (regulator of RpoE activity)